MRIDIRFITMCIISLALEAWASPCPPEQVQRLIPSCQDGGTFGEALSLLDRRLVVGRFDARGGRVSTLVLDSQSRDWLYESEIRPADLDSPDAFGHSVELHYDELRDRWVLAAGSPSKSSLAPSAGKAYVYELNGQGQWVAQSEVLPNQVTSREWFGNKVIWATVNGRTFLVVGAPGSDGHQIVGSVYAFEQDEQGLWTQQARLQAPGGLPENAFGFALGSAESSTATILVVGAYSHAHVPNPRPGSAYFYRFDESRNEWLLESQFAAPNPVNSDLFGFDVDVKAVVDLPGFTHRAAIGRPAEGGGGSSVGPGAIYTYLRRVGGEWELESRIGPPRLNETEGRFGWSVDFDSEDPNRLLAGAPNSGEFDRESGSAYVIERDPNQGEWRATEGLWGQQQDAYDAFGADVAFGNGASAESVVIGALATQCPGGSQLNSIGAAYSFDLNPGNGGDCPAPVITLQKVPDCSSGPGGEIEVRWFQATPDQRARIALLYAKRTGNFIIPNGNPCSGTSLQLGQLGLQVAYVGSAGQFGAGRLKRTVPRSVCGGYLQLVDVTRCATSNVVRIE